MKTKRQFALLGAVCAFIGITLTETRLPAQAPEKRESQRPANQGSSQVHTYEQKPITSAPEIIPAVAVRKILEDFRAGYPKLEKPRILIYINRELVDQDSGLKLAGKEETVVSTKREAARDLQSDTAAAGRGETKSEVTVNAGRDVTVVGSGDPSTGKATVSSTEQKVANVNKYEVTERQTTSTEYKQMIRDVEQTFGKRLRSAGASLADQRVATQLIADRPIGSFTTPTEGEQAHKDRAALAKVADVVVEILITSREMQVSKTSGDVLRSVPEIHATAIRLKDSKVMGQANAWDVIGQKARANFVSSTFTSREIADATAVLLMQDMLVEVQ